MPYHTWIITLADRLLWTSLQAVVLVGVIALVIRTVPRLPASTRCVMWWLVAAQVIIGLWWPSSINLPFQASPIRVVATYVSTQPVAGSSVMTSSRDVATLPVGWASVTTWQAGLVLLWLCGVLAQVPKLIRDASEMHRLLANAKAPAAPLQRMCESLSSQIGLIGCPRLRTSAAVTSPMVTGLIQPVLLWPTNSDLSRSEASFVMVHELLHLRRRDLWSGSVAALAQCLFFFHPLVRWAVREYATQREAACDAAAMRRCAADPREYGALLLRLGVSRSPAGTIGGASATYRSLKRRLAMLPLAGAPVPRVRALVLVAAVAAAGLAPYRTVSARAPALAPNPTVVVPHRGSGATEASDKCVSADTVPFCGAKFVAVMGSTNPHQSVVVFVHGNVVIDGTYADTRAARQFFRPDINLMWIRRRNGIYVVKDPVVLRSAETSIVPSFRQRSALLDRQGALLNTQGALLREQSRLMRMRARTIDATSQQGGSATREEASRSAIYDRIRAQETKIDTLQRSLGAQQSRLEKQQKALNARFNGLPARLMELADDAIANGAARAVTP